MLRTLLLCASLGAVPGFAYAALPKSSPEQAVAAARDCAAAAGPARVDLSALEKLLWKPATISNRGKQVDTPLVILGKAEGGPIIMTSRGNDAAPTGCIVTGSLPKTGGFEQVRNAFGQAFQSAGSKDGAYYFRIGSDIVVLTASGSTREPGFHAIILEIGERN